MAARGDGSLAVQAAQRPRDFRPAVENALADIVQQLEGKDGGSAHMQTAARLLGQVAVLLRNQELTMDSEVASYLRELLEREDARSGNPLVRQLQLIEVLQRQAKQHRSGGTKRVLAAAPEVEPGLVPLRQAPRREYSSKPSFYEALGNERGQPPPVAIRNAELVQQTSFMHMALEAAKQPAEAQQEYMAMLSPALVNTQ